MPKLPKRLIKKFGISKRAWIEFRKEQGSRRRPRTTKTKSKPKRAKTMAKKKSYRRKAKSLFTKGFIEGAGSEALKVLAHKFVGPNPLYDAVIDGGIGVIRNNKTLQGKALAEGIMAFLPNIGSTGSSISGYEE